MYGRLLCGLVAILLVLMILTPIAGPVINIVKAEAVGYLAIKDYLGTTWTLEDVEKIINTTIQTVDGELKSLADYFWIVVDDDPENNKYNLRDFIRSPLDNTTAVLPLTPGDHYIDIYWFGFHQRQLVNIVENTTYVLNLETAPVMPFQTAGEPPSDYEWDLARNPDGLTISRRDGKAWIRFNYNQTYITVAWYDSDLNGWQYYPLDIDINSGYDWRFHITDPANPTYTEEHTGSFLWFTWDVAKVAEKIKWNRTKQILHVVYTVVVAENQALFNAVDEFWSAAARTIVEIASGKQYIDPVTGTIHRLEDFVTFVQSAYNTYMGELYASKYQKTIVLIWDVFCTPTQIVVQAHCYDVDENGEKHPRPITSDNAFTINSRMVFVKLLHGGLAFNLHAQISLSGTKKIETIVPSYTFKYGSADETFSIALPVNYRFYVDDLSMYDYEFWYSYRESINLKLIIYFNDTSKADLFQTNLDNKGFTYTRNGNEFRISITSGTTILEDFQEIEDIIPSSKGYIQYTFDPVVKTGTIDGSALTGYIHIYMHCLPKMIPPQVSLLKDGYQKITRAFAVQVFTDLYRSDSESYVLGYYILGNEPPPSYIIRDIHPDIEQDVMHYVYTIISTDCYGQDIVDELGSIFEIPSSLYIYAKYSDMYIDHKVALYADRLYYKVFVSSSVASRQVKVVLVLKNGTTITLFSQNANGISDEKTIYYNELNITYNDIDSLYLYDQYLTTLRVYSDGRVSIRTDNTDKITITVVDTPLYEYAVSIVPTIRTIDNVTLALFNLNRMSFLNLAPEIIEYLLAIPPSEGGWGTPIIDWATVSAITLNFSRPYELYYYNKENDMWIRVKPVYYNDTKIYDIVRYSDNVLIEKLNVSEISQYYYKLIYTDTNETYKGWLWNDNGTLKMITGQVIWSLTNAELQQLLEMVQLQGIMDQWAQAWEDIAKKLGLISEGLAAAANWFNANWIWLLLGFFGVMFMILLIFALASRPRITVAVPRTR